jgi:hypothetical protein
MLPFFPIFSQEDWDFDKNKNEEIFLDTRAINGHTVNVLEQKVLELRITHRFGEIATPQSYRTLFGLDNSSDIRIGFEYGINDNFMLGVGRSKGGGPFLEFWDGFAKWNLYNNENIPLKITLASKVFFTSMQSSTVPSELTYFSKFSHRLTYHHELLIAYKPTKKLSVQIQPGFTYLNLANYQDDNFNPVLGTVLRCHLFKKVSLLAEYFINGNTSNYRQNNFTNPFGIGIEINTSGHVFLLNFVNSKGLGEGQFIPYTSSKWGEGEFRFGFTIARKFNN